ncbi:MAG: serine/threonine-protein kinase, partial [Pseudomonadota bacterium]
MTIAETPPGRRSHQPEGEADGCEAGASQGSQESRERCGSEPGRGCEQLEPELAGARAKRTEAVTDFQVPPSFDAWRRRSRRRSGGERIDAGAGNWRGGSSGGDKGAGGGEGNLLVPDTMVDHFRVVRLVGRGGMGEVYLARDTLLNRRVALKIVNPRFLDSDEAVARFMREAQLTAGFSHPHIVTVFAVGKHDGRPYLALEYLEGQNLRQRMDEERPGVRESLRIVLAIAQALVEAHSHRVLHRDLKPENVVLAKDGRLRLVDLGLAKVRAAVTGSRNTIREEDQDKSQDWDRQQDEGRDRDRTTEREQNGSLQRNRCRVDRDRSRDSDSDGRLAGGGDRPWHSPGLGSACYHSTAAGTVQGTPAYMAPEQWRGEECSEATDIWALGVVLHELLIGRRPYQGKRAFVATLVMGAEPVRSLVPSQEIPAELTELVG